MTLSPWVVYVWGQVDFLRDVFGPLSILGSIIGVILTVICAVLPESEFADKSASGRFRKLARTIVVIAVLSILGYCFTPSSKTVATMVVLPAIVNSQPIQKDLPEIYNLGVEALKSKLKPEAEKK